MGKEETKEKIQLLKGKEELLKSEYDKYLEMPIIKSFLELQETYLNIIKERSFNEQILSNMEKSECNHPLWFVFSSEEKENKVQWVCRCVHCNLVRTDYPIYFEHYIYGPALENDKKHPLYLFQAVQFDYEEDKKNKDIVKNLILKYSKKTQ
jgi:hypothetical protein